MDKDKVLPLVTEWGIGLIGARKQQAADWERVKPLIEAAREFLRQYPYQYSKETHYIPRSMEVQTVDLDAIAQALAQLGEEVSDASGEVDRQVERL